MRDKRYQKLLNSKRWKELRVAYLQQHPLCEMCEKEGYVRSAVDLHHIKPISASNTDAEMTRLCFDVNNIMALCVQHHIFIHKTLGKNTKANVQARRKQQLERWKERIRSMSSEQTTLATPFLLQGVDFSEISSCPSVLTEEVSESDFSSQ